MGAKAELQPKKNIFTFFLTEVAFLKFIAIFFIYISTGKPAKFADTIRTVPIARRKHLQYRRVVRILTAKKNKVIENNCSKT